KRLLSAAFVMVDGELAKSRVFESKPPFWRRLGALAVLSFAFMVNAAFFAKLPEDILNLAADAIRRVQYRLDSHGSTDKLRSCLLGLAVAAAANRSHRLADELFILIRSYRRY